MNRTGWLIIAAGFIASTWAVDSGENISETPKTSTRPQRHQTYREVIMYLTPSQLQHLKETQSEHGMILSTSQPNLSQYPQNEDSEKNVLKQQHTLEREHSINEVVITKPFNKPEPSNNVVKEIQEQQLQQQQLEQNLQQQQILEQDANRQQEQQYKEDIFKQEYERQQSQSHNNLHLEELHHTDLLENEPQNLDQQKYIYLNPEKVNSNIQPVHELKQLFYPDEEFIKFIGNQHQSQLNLQSDFLQKQNYQTQFELDHRPHLGMQLQGQTQVDVHPQPQIEVIVQPQVEIKPQPQQFSLHQDFQFIPYQYAPEQQHAHQQLGQQIFQQQVQYLQDQPKDQANALHQQQQQILVSKLNQQQELEFGKQILEHNLQALQDKSNQRQADAIQHEHKKLSQVNLQVQHLELSEKTNEKPKELPKNIPRIQELGRLDLLQSLKNEELRQKFLQSSQVTHLDMLKNNNNLQLQYAPNFYDQKFSIADIEKINKNIRQEKLKAQATIDAIANSPPVVIKEISVVKHRPIERIKTVKVPIPAPYLVPVPQPYKVSVPQPYPVPLEIIRHYAVPIIKTEKVEVEKPVPVEVEKHVNFDVEKKVYVHVNKPYPVERFVPVEIKKEIPVHIPVYKPKKLHILRHVW